MSKNIDEAKTCSVCGTALSGVDESCPVCMLRIGLAGGVESGESSTFEDTVRPTPGQTVKRFEHYELVTGEDGKPVELGRGAMGVTYKAFDVDLRLPVTLKLINEKYIGDESMQLRFLREARAAARLRHSNVASVLHLGRTGSSYFYAMEFVEGETLENLIKRSGRLEVKLALEITTQVAAGLAAVHKQKLVHRDIKPSNIMVSLEDGGALTAKIIDLGLAKTVNESGSQAGISMAGDFAGTPEFASPEQFAGVGVDIRSDLYALGVMLWRTVTGRSMFRGSPYEVMYQHQHAPLPLEKLEAVPQPVVVLLEVLLEKDPGRRFQNPAELLKAMPTIISAIEAGRRITRQSLQKNPPADLRVGTGKPAAKLGPEKISGVGSLTTGSGVFGREDDRVASVTRQPEPERLSPPLQKAPTGASAALVPGQGVPLSHPVPASKNHFWPIAGTLMAILLAGAVWIFLSLILNPTPNQEPQVVTERHSQKTGAAFGSHSPPQPGKPWTNSLDMHFVPLWDIYVSEWQTRKRDFEAFVQATGYDAVGGMSSAVTQNGFKLNEMSWRAPGFQQTPEHPVVGVSWEDGNQFCAWLTKKERTEGTLTEFQSYRLPSDREWSRAVGLEHEQGNSPEDRSGKIEAVYPWGDAFPPPDDIGNYAGSESRVDVPETWSVIPGFHDAFPRTAPVSAFKANARGLCCIGGNVWEWCMDKLGNTMNWRTLRGGSWATSRAAEMLSSYRRGYGPSFRCDDVGFRCVIATGGAHE
jgi:serine/threonine protein kinase/formylglycine-generating enzyme required for sulfatase activity